MEKNSVSSLLTPLDNLFTTEQEREEAKRETIIDIPLTEIDDFPHHPFKVRVDENMLEMMDSDLIDVITFNTSLKNRLTEFVEKYPEECYITDRDDYGSISCEIRKGRMSFKLSAPYSEDRRKRASNLAKQNTNRLRNQKP